jgi:hypothetical protein
MTTPSLIGLDFVVPNSFMTLSLDDGLSQMLELFDIHKYDELYFSSIFFKLYIFKYLRLLGS